MRHRYHTGRIDKSHRQANTDAILVFGSNLAGRHGAGAALEAYRHWCAIYTVGQGPTGFAYALPTKDEQLNALPLEAIREHVQDFMKWAQLNASKTFLVTAVGTGLAGLRHEDVAPMFWEAPDNCVFPPEW